MNKKTENRFVIGVLLICLVLISLPYFYVLEKNREEEEFHKAIEKPVLYEEKQVLVPAPEPIRKTIVQSAQDEIIEEAVESEAKKSFSLSLISKPTTPTPVPPKKPPFQKPGDIPPTTTIPTPVVVLPPPIHPVIPSDKVIAIKWKRIHVGTQEILGFKWGDGTTCLVPIPSNLDRGEYLCNRPRATSKLTVDFPASLEYQITVGE